MTMNEQQMQSLLTQIKTSKIETRATDQLVPYARNARKHEPWQVAQIAASIKEFGFTNPVLIDETGEIVAGHGRVMAALKLDLPEVPCIVLGHLTKTQRKAYVLADNQLALNSSWDMGLLSVELDELKLDGFDLDVLGFPQDIDEVIASSIGSLESSDNKEDAENIYTSKIEAPIYEIKGEKPEIKDLIDTSKMTQLIKEIEGSNISKEEKEFLKFASYRHNVFNYENIAEFYAHADPELKDLMEKSALVIIDYKKAIENGFVQMSTVIADMFDTEHPEEGSIDEE